MNATEARVFQRKLAVLNRGANKVIDLKKAAAREARLVGELEASEPMPGPDPLRELTDLEFVVWAMGQVSASGVRPISNCALGRVLKVSEGRIRQLRESARVKLGGLAR
jgi:hypothetical protein